MKYDSEPRGAAQNGMIKKLRDHFTFQMYSMIAGGNYIRFGISLFLSSCLVSMQSWAEAPGKCCYSESKVGGTVLLEHVGDARFHVFVAIFVNHLPGSFNQKAS